MRLRGDQAALFSFFFLRSTFCPVDCYALCISNLCSPRPLSQLSRRQRQNSNRARFLSHSSSNPSRLVRASVPAPAAAAAAKKKSRTCRRDCFLQHHPVGVFFIHFFYLPNLRYRSKENEIIALFSLSSRLSHVIAQPEVNSRSQILMGLFLFYLLLLFSFFFSYPPLKESAYLYHILHQGLDLPREWKNSSVTFFFFLLLSSCIQERREKKMPVREKMLPGWISLKEANSSRPRLPSSPIFFSFSLSLSEILTWNHLL